MNKKNEKLRTKIPRLTKRKTPTKDWKLHQQILKVKIYISKTIRKETQKHAHLKRT